PRSMAPTASANRRSSRFVPSIDQHVTSERAARASRANGVGLAGSPRVSALGGPAGRSPPDSLCPGMISCAPSRRFSKECPMVLTKAQLISSLQNEVRILLHLADKVDARSLDYRPTPKQRSTIEWLRYLTIMGPALASAAKTGTFDGEAWGAATKASSTMNLD